MTVSRFPGYVYSEEEHPGTVGAHNHFVLTNPVGSGKVILIGGVFVSQTTAGAVAGAPPLRGYRATGVPSGGTLVDPADIGKTRSTLDDPVGEVRTEGASVTLGAAWFNSPAVQAIGAASAPFVHQIPAALPGTDPITLYPGESTALRTDAGDTDQRWNISIAWAEVG